LAEIHKDQLLEICVFQKSIERDLVIALVGYRPSMADVERIQESLAALAPTIGYAVYANGFSPGDCTESLFDGADLVITNAGNIGYGRAVNALAGKLVALPPYFAAANIDLYWQPGSVEALLASLQGHPEVSLAVPAICDEEGILQKLCKRNPTILALISRRFIPDFFKPPSLKRYDQWYVMGEKNYEEPFECQYLSGCFMLFRGDVFEAVGGFDERYFLYLEDADISRSASLYGRCMHLPIASVVHRWGRGSHKNIRLAVVNIFSAWKYFRKWGVAWW
jgi:GT2 family glycosyltransferase